MKRFIFILALLWVEIAYSSEYEGYWEENIWEKDIDFNKTKEFKSNYMIDKTKNNQLYSRFFLDLEVNGKKIEGNYCYTTNFGQMIDCQLEHDINNVSGFITNDIAYVSFTSSFGGDLGEAEIVSDNNILHWKITKEPSSQFYAPIESKLVRISKKSDNFPHLCYKQDVVLFSCATNDGKLASLCSIDSSRENLYYQFGSKKNIELFYNKPLFMGNYKRIPPLSAEIISHQKQSISFINNNYKYEILGDVKLKQKNEDIMEMQEFKIVVTNLTNKKEYYNVCDITYKNNIRLLLQSLQCDIKNKLGCF